MDNVMIRHGFAKGILSVFIAVLVAGMALAIVPLTTAQADTTFNVNSPADTVDAFLGDGICADATGACTLRAAIMEANALPGDDTIILPPGTYTLTIGGAGENLAVTGDLDILEDLTIIGAGPSATIIDANGLDRVFHITGPVVVEINGVAITGGLTPTVGMHGEGGGGIYNEGDLTLTDCDVHDNETGSGADGSPNGGDAGWGGGIYSSGPLTLNGVDVFGNDTGHGGAGGDGGYGGDGGRGGGIFSSDSATLTDCTVIDNTAGYGGDGGDNQPSGGGWNGRSGADGGGIYNDGFMTLDRCAVSNNTTGYGGDGGDGDSGNGGNGARGGCGGGIYCCEDATLIMTDCTVSGNMTGHGGAGGDGPIDGGSGGEGGGGGGIFSDEATVALLNCTVSGNVTGYGGEGGSGHSSIGGWGGDGGSGGGISSYDSIMLTNCTVSGNTTGYGGAGGSGETPGSMGNGGLGGGIFSDGSLTLNNCTVTLNSTGGSGGDGGGIYDATRNTSIHPKNTIIADNTAARYGPDCYGNLTSEGCNLVGDDSQCSVSSQPGDQIGTGLSPIDPRLGLLRDNGGPTYTHALLDGSPALDGVSDDCECTTRAGETLTEDQRGAPRPIDGNEDGTALCDIGAYERQPAPAGLPGPEQEDDEVAVGGTVEPIDLSQLDDATDQPHGATSTHTSVTLWIGLASALTVAGATLALTRRRAR